GGARGQQLAIGVEGDCVDRIAVLLERDLLAAIIDERCELDLCVIAARSQSLAVGAVSQVEDGVLMELIERLGRSIEVGKQIVVDAAGRAGFAESDGPEVTFGTERQGSDRRRL